MSDPHGSPGPSHASLESAGLSSGWRRDEVPAKGFSESAPELLSIWSAPSKYSLHRFMKGPRSSAYKHQQLQFEDLQGIESILAGHNLHGPRGLCTSGRMNSYQEEGQSVASGLLNHPRMRILKIALQSESCCLTHETYPSPYPGCLLVHPG